MKRIGLQVSHGLPGCAYGFDFHAVYPPAFGKDIFLYGSYQPEADPMLYVLFAVTPESPVFFEIGFDVACLGQNRFCAYFGSIAEEYL